MYRQRDRRKVHRGCCSDIPLSYFTEEVYAPFQVLHTTSASITSKYTYYQCVNHCEAQYEIGSVFMFGTKSEICVWLLLPQCTGVYIIAHCRGSFDFQFIYYHFLSDKVLRMKKAKAPLLRGNKIISVTVMKDIKLIDSYSFVHIALSKFSDMFQFAEVISSFIQSS